MPSLRKALPRVYKTLQNINDSLVTRSLHFLTKSRPLPGSEGEEREPICLRAATRYTASAGRAPFHISWRKADKHLWLDNRTYVNYLYFTVRCVQSLSLDDEKAEISVPQ